MKQYRVLIAIAVLCIVATSCKKDFFTGVNTSPNVVTYVTPNLLLPTVEAALGYTQGGDFSRFSSMLTQQTYGFQNQTSQFYRYQINPGTFDNVWPDLYTSLMENDYTLMQDADAKGYNEYSGISRIVMAYSLQLAVDNWGDVPYSESFQANKAGGTVKPKYDKAQALYDTITHLVDAAIKYLNNADAGGITPGADDGIYGGDANKWIQFGHAIKARLAIHQSKGNAALANNAITEANQSFAGNDDIAQYHFSTEATGANPWYQFGRDRQGYITFSNSTLAGILTGLNDPRFPVFIDPNNDGGGASPSGTYYGGLPDYYGAVNAPVEFITYDELLFIKAEATLRSSGNIATAQTFYQQAIRFNMQKLGIADADINTYITANGTLPATVNDAISKIALQEYIALYLNPEAFTLWRRTGVPTLKPTAGTNGIPRRYVYPQTEYDLNTANTPVSTLYTPKIFWDK